MKIVIDKAIVSEVFVSEERGTQYGTLQCENGTFKLSARKGGFNLAGLPRMEPMRVQGELRGRIFQNGQSLEVIDMTVDLLNGKKTG